MQCANAGKQTHIHTNTHSHSLGLSPRTASRFAHTTSTTTTKNTRNSHARESKAKKHASTQLIQHVSTAAKHTATNNHRQTHAASEPTTLTASNDETITREMHSLGEMPQRKRGTLTFGRVLLLLAAVLLAGRSVAAQDETATNVIDHRSATESPLGSRAGGTTDASTDDRSRPPNEAQRAVDLDRLVDEMLVKGTDVGRASDADGGQTLVAGDLGLNLGDLEDLQPTTVESGSGDEFRLDDRAVSEATTASPTGGNNVYKVLRSSRPTTTAAPVPNANDVVPASGGEFETYKSLFDHSKWNASAIAHAVGSRCSQELHRYLSDYQAESTWALQASDQSGRYRGMYFYGNEFWVGNVLFCAEINEQRRGKSPEMQRHQPELEFFITTLAVTIPQRTAYGKPSTNLQLGQCLPKTCSLHDVEHILSSDPAVHELNSRNGSSVSVLQVRTVPGPYRMLEDGRCVLLLTILGVCIVLTIVGTFCEWRLEKRILRSQATNKSIRFNGKASMVDRHAYDAGNNNNNNNGHNGQQHHAKGHTNKAFEQDTQLELHQIQNVTNAIIGAPAADGHKTHRMMVNEERQKQGIVTQLLMCFSLKLNGRAILTAKKLSDESVSCIHGMRMISMLWTMMAHTFLQTYGISENKFGRVITERDFQYQLIGNANFAVDTFFFLSGLLVTLLFLRTDEAFLRKHKRRLHAVAEAKKVLLLYLYRYIRLTPVYFVALLCSEVSLKFIYNRSVFQPGLTDHAVCPDFWWRNMLYIQNWFPFPQLCMIWSWYLANDMQFYVWAVIMLTLASRYFKTMTTLTIALLLSSWVVTASLSLSVNYTFDISEPLITFGFLYDMPWTRIGPYIMGMFAGYMIFRFKEPPKFSTPFVLAMWAVSMVMMFMIVCGTWMGTLSLVDTALYMSLSHSGWGFALIWITLACRWGYSGYIARFLAYPAFLPLSRLTYCTYLIHPVTQIATAFYMHGAFHLSFPLVLTIFVGNAVFSYACAFALCVLCEAPVVNILRILFKK